MKKQEKTHREYKELSKLFKPLINKYYWKGIIYPSGKDDWKKFEKNNPTIVLNVLFVNEMDICPVFILKCNSDCEKQIILLMIPNGEESNYHAVKNRYEGQRKNIACFRLSARVSFFLQRCGR